MIPIEGGAIVVDSRRRAIAVIDEAAALAWKSGDWRLDPEVPVPAREHPERGFSGDFRESVVWQLDIVLCGKSIRLRSRVPARNIGVLPRIAHLAQSLVGPPSHVFDLVENAGKYQLWQDGNLAFTTSDSADLVGEVYGVLLELAHSPRRLMLLAHAAALIVGGRSLMLSAASGGGKTTLSVGLIHAGAFLLSDDTVGIDQDDLGLTGLPVALRVREAGWPVIAPRMPPKAGSIAPNASGLRHIPPSWVGGTVDHAPPASAAILLDFVPGADCSVTPIDSARGLAALIESGASLAESTDPAIAAPAIAVWCGKTRFYRLRYASMDDGIAGIHKIRADLS